MIDVLLWNIETVSQEIEKELMNLITREKKEKLKRFIFREDRIRSLCGEILSRYIIIKKLNINNNEIILKKREYGKPYIEGYKFDFNISHSGKWVVCAGGNIDAVGVDIEAIRDIDMKIAEEYFTAREAENIKSKNGIDRLNCFFKFWTLKESHIKCTGNGLREPLNSIEFSNENGEIISNINGYNYKSFSPDKEHILSLCTKEKISLRTEVILEAGILIKTLQNKNTKN